MKRPILLLLLLMLCGSIAMAQQNPLYSQYMFNALVINPAYAGTQPYMSSTMFVRKQWVGFNGAPLTASATLHGPLKNKRMGLGMLINNDHIGITNQTDLYACYSYHLPIQEGTLSMGLSGGISFYRSNLSDLTVWDANDQVYELNSLSNQLPNFGTGLYYYSPKWYAGLSVPQLLSYDPEKGLNAKKSSMHHPVPHYYFTTGFILGNSEDIKFKPSCMIKYVQGAPFQFDVNLNVLFNQIVWVGASYRYHDAVVAIFEYQLSRKLRLGYAYDYPVTTLSTVTSGTHEIMMGYDFGYDIMKIKNPRYF
ncbi:MAG: type IX secretion system membrane protein PorP/SprF [Bacteroidia bacterium]